MLPIWKYFNLLPSIVGLIHLPLYLQPNHEFISQKNLGGQPLDHIFNVYGIPGNKKKSWFDPIEGVPGSQLTMFLKFDNCVEILLRKLEKSPKNAIFLVFHPYNPKFETNYIPYPIENVARNTMEPFVFSQNSVFLSYDVIMTSFFTIFSIFSLKMIFCINLHPVKRIINL